MSNPAALEPAPGRSERIGPWPRALLLLLALALGACGAEEAQGGPGGAAGGGARPPAEVSVVTIATRDVPLTSELPGRTAPYLVAEVRPQVGGLVLERAFDEGADVEAGEVLYRIDPAGYEIAVAAAKAELQRAEAALATASATAKRVSKLASQGISSEQANDDAAGAVRAARAQVSAAQASLAAASLDLERTQVLAPIGGRTSRSAVKQGALVIAFQTQLATVQQLDPIYVDITRPSVEILRLQKALAAGRVARPDGETDLDGAEVTLLLEDGTSYPHAGRLAFTDATVGADTGAVTLRAVFPNPDHQLLPGMYVRAVIEEGIVPNAILVPQRGVSRDPSGRATALVVNGDGVVEQRILATTRTLGDQWLVTSGVAVGDRVIVEGLQKVRAGAPAKAVPFRPDADADGAAEGKAVAPTKPTAPAAKPETPPTDASKATTAAADGAADGKPASDAPADR
ncbi:MAG: efflux RND transporter periplasmic adaptor subunit [Deltaproteobacteria bacterium]|nr:MAG: efflux RND transporter periplasmic adaptor subunit [Deltaproteobacteria bacterium]